MNFCGTNLRKPNKEEREQLELLVFQNPQKENESDENYIMRLINLVEIHS